MKELILIEPVFKEAIWGGNRLRTDFHYEIPSDKTGECWAVSAHANGDCLVKEGSYKGKHLAGSGNIIESCLAIWKEMYFHY